MRSTILSRGPVVLPAPVAEPGPPGASAVLRRTDTEIEWRRDPGGRWTLLVPLTELRGEPGPAGSTFVGTVTVAQVAKPAIPAGLREVEVAASWAVPSGRYIAVVDSGSVNGGPATPGYPAGYAVVSVCCRVAGVLVVTLHAPLLAVGKGFAMQVAVYRLG